MEFNQAFRDGQTKAASLCQSDGLVPTIERIKDVAKLLGLNPTARIFHTQLQRPLVSHMNVDFDSATLGAIFRRVV